MKRVFVLLLLGATLAASAQVKLKIGSITLPADSSAGCIQIPILIEDTEMDGRGLFDLGIELEITGDLGIIDGGVATPMLVGLGFSGVDMGIRNPPVDLENEDAMTNPTPTCGNIYSQATLGFPELEFVAPLVAGLNPFSINNNDGPTARKIGYVFNAGLGTMGNLSLNQDVMVAALEIPIVDNPGEGEITISAVGANFIDWWDDAVFFPLDLDLSEGPGTIRFCPSSLASTPDDTVACPGEDVSFTVTIDGAGPFAYQWRKDEVDIPGATSATLNLMSVTGDDAGSYDCHITSTCTDQFSPGATLTIGDLEGTVSPPGIALGLVQPTLTADLICAIADPTYTWRDNDGMVVGSGSTLLLDPPLDVPVQVFTLDVVDGGGRELAFSIPVLVNPLGLDLNNDGFNTIDDLFLVVPDWRSGNWDADGDGIQTVLDMLFIRVPTF